jgi:hypothetical protein
MTGASLAASATPPLLPLLLPPLLLAPLLLAPLLLAPLLLPPLLVASIPPSVFPLGLLLLLLPQATYVPAQTTNEAIPSAPT